MKLKVVENKKELGIFVSNIVQEVIERKNKENKNAVLGLPTGSTPLPVYEELSNRCLNKSINFNNTITFNLDEYVGIDYSNPNSYHKFMDDNLFNNININRKNIHIPDGNSFDLEEAADKYEKMIIDTGGIDIQLLGIGSNGHIGFNEPAENLKLKTNIVNLTDKTIEDNSRFFTNKEEVPKQAITMGIGTIFNADKIILMATGKNKKDAINKLLNEDVLTTLFPATLLKLHKDFTVVIDKELYNEINK